MREKINKVIKSERTKNIVIVLIVSLFIIFSAATLVYFSSFGGSESLADQAEREYSYWQNNSVKPYSSQGEKYCSHFNVELTEWCAYFVGYCADECGVGSKEVGFAPNTRDFMNNLISMKAYRKAGEYTPKRGNVILFSYSGRKVHNETGTTDHVGIVVNSDPEKREITVVCGNEGGSCDTSKVNRYILSMDDDNIACYGEVASTANIIPTDLNMLVREIICHNETGKVYSKISSEYGTVIQNDVGALSIGVFCWHGNYALDVLQKAYSINQKEVLNILNTSYGGSAVKYAILKNTDWSSYIPNDDVCIAIKKVLLSPSGKKAQDEMSLKFSQNYISICKSHGLKDKNVIAYCSDILNQYGEYSFDGGVLSFVTPSMTLDNIYNSGAAFSDSNYDYEYRRSWTYNYIKNRKE